MTQKGSLIKMFTHKFKYQHQHQASRCGINVLCLEIGYQNRLHPSTQQPQPVPSSHSRAQYRTCPRALKNSSLISSFVGNAEIEAINGRRGWKTEFVALAYQNKRGSNSDANEHTMILHTMIWWHFLLFPPCELRCKNLALLAMLSLVLSVECLLHASDQNRDYPLNEMVCIPIYNSKNKSALLVNLLVLLSFFCSVTDEKIGCSVE